MKLQSESHFENASRISRSTIQSYSTKNCIMIVITKDFVIITVIEKRNNISYKLTSLIADNNVSPNPYCIKENGKMEQFTDNYFMDVQRINFWQSDFNDTNPVDVPLITGEFYEQYFDSDMDLTNFAKLIIPGDRERITKNHIKNNILNISDTIFKELCVERRNFIIDFLSKRNETDKFLRNYLKMKNIINLSYNNNEHKNVYEMKFCRNVNVVEKFLMVVMKKIPATQEFQWLQKIMKYDRCKFKCLLHATIKLTKEVRSPK
uniref:ODV-EC43 n=1 Tax=Strongyloides venezuelensis TaxID=75913 RepID=A0A0K0F964_STRVS